MTPEFVGSEEFVVAIGSVLGFTALGVPLLEGCLGHFLNGEFIVGCLSGSLFLVVVGVTFWKFHRAVRTGHVRYGDGPAPQSEE